MENGYPLSYAKLRDFLISDGTIVDGVFVKDYSFTSSSAAVSEFLADLQMGEKSGRYWMVERTVSMVE